VAGTIGLWGPASQASPGQGSWLISGNGCREKVVTTAGNAIPIPEGVSDEVAAGVPVTYGTALHGLKDRGQLRPGETVAVLGAAGGAGLAAVEIARLMVARVIAVASSSDKLAIAAPMARPTASTIRRGFEEPAEGTDRRKGHRHALRLRWRSLRRACAKSVAWEGRYLVVDCRRRDPALSA
jgi:NADPH2:quinone reductase